METQASLDEIVVKLSMIGLEVEGVADRAKDLAPFTVAYVKEAKPHPNADRLRVCLVDTGTQIVQVVCGAPNARTGMKGVFAPAGYQEPFTAEADRCLRALFESRGDISYSFRHYPFHRACNRLAKSDRHPKACLAHRAAEAAGTLGGNEAYWAMHEWLMTHQDELSEETLRATAAAIGLDANQLITVMSSPEIDTMINADARRGTHLGLRSIPLVFVNKRALPRWRLEGRCMIEDIVELAAQERTP